MVIAPWSAGRFGNHDTGGSLHQADRRGSSRAELALVAGDDGSVFSEPEFLAVVRLGFHYFG